MPSSRHVTLHHSPNTRSTGALILLEELGADYELNVLNMKTGEQRQAAYLAVNPMGKVPAVEHAGALVTEQGAVFLYLADLYPEAGLAPPIGDPLRGREEVLRRLDRELEDLAFREAELAKREEAEDRARQAAALLPSDAKLDKILRYETALERQLYRAMNQLERLQRRRLGDAVPAPVALEVSTRN